MTKHSLGNFKLTFGSDSAIVQHIQAHCDDPPPWILEDDKLVLEFDLDLNAPLLPPNANYINSLMRARSPSTAESVLKGLSFTLRTYAEFDAPRHLKLALADALDRVIEEGESVKFLYGKQERSGSPNMDLLDEFLVFEIVEQIHSEHEPYSASGSHDGAYEHTAELLKDARIFDKPKPNHKPKPKTKGEDEIKRIRLKVIEIASSDLEYFFQMIQYLKKRGYKISQ